MKVCDLPFWIVDIWTIVASCTMGRNKRRPSEVHMVPAKDLEVKGSPYGWEHPPWNLGPSTAAPGVRLRFCSRMDLSERSQGTVQLAGSLPPAWENWLVSWLMAFVCHNSSICRNVENEPADERAFWSLALSDFHTKREHGIPCCKGQLLVLPLHVAGTAMEMNLVSFQWFDFWSTWG